MSLVKLRSACNRCHSQKLRCVRKSGQEVCERCRRLQTPCQFAPRARRGSRQVRGSHQGQISQPEGLYGDAVDGDGEIGGLGELGELEGLGHSVTIPSDSAHMLDALLDDHFGPWSGGWASLDPAGSSLGFELPMPSIDALPLAESSTLASSVHALAKMNVALYELMAILQPMPVIEGDAVRDQGQEKPYIFDTLLDLTSTFIDVLTRLSRNTRIDGGTILMVGSCHSRLAEIYMSLFRCMRGCIKHSGTPRFTPGCPLVLPPLQLGSLTSPGVRIDGHHPIPPVLSSMYMSMITMFSSQLWKQVSTLVAQHCAVGGDYGFSAPNAPSDGIWAQITHQTKGLLHMIGETKSML